MDFNKRDFLPKTFGFGLGLTMKDEDEGPRPEI